MYKLIMIALAALWLVMLTGEFNLDGWGLFILALVASAAAVFVGAVMDGDLD